MGWAEPERFGGPTPLLFGPAHPEGEVDMPLHRVVTGALDGLATGAQQVVASVAGGAKGAGGAIMGALDGPPRQVVGMEGPHRIIDRALNGLVDGATNGLSQGVIGSLKIAGGGINRALDQPVEQLGLPNLERGLRFPGPLRRR